MKFSVLDRKAIIHWLQGEIFDCLVIGGGITGSGIALDGATRGLKMALIEMQDFAAGTSSRSTKLIHGGLRYLKQFQLKSVAEVGKERAIVYENSPHVTKPVWMLLPIYKGNPFGLWMTSIGLQVYDFLAGVKKKERREILSAMEVLTKVPLIKQTGLRGGGYYVEYRTDDARLTIEVIKAAFANGAAACNYLKVINLLYKNEKVNGVLVEDQLTKEKYEIYAKRVVNAAGPWVDQIRELDHAKKEKMLRLTKGVHLVIDRSLLPLTQAVYFDIPDGRMVFAIPRGGKTYVGTTDTFYAGKMANPKVTISDQKYLINAIHYLFPGIKLTEKDIESSWAGIRPLIYEQGKKASEISRQDEIWIAESNLITIAGGKLTGYRKMAENVVDLLTTQLLAEVGRNFAECQTRHIPVSGGDVGGPGRMETYVAAQLEKGIALGFTSGEAKNLASFYGSNTPVVFELANQSKADAEKYQLPLLLFAKLIYGIEAEMVVTPLDFFYRRTAALQFDIKTVHQYKHHVCAFMAEKIGWTVEERQKYTTELDQALTDAVTPIDQIEDFRSGT